MSQMGEWLNQYAGYISSALIIFGVWNKLAENRNKRLIDTIEKTNKPHLKRLDQNDQQIKDLTKIANRNIDLHERHEKRLDDHEIRIVRLETTNENGKQKTTYKEIHRGENS